MIIVWQLIVSKIDNKENEENRSLLKYWILINKIDNEENRIIVDAKTISLCMHKNNFNLICCINVWSWQVHRYLIIYKVTCFKYQHNIYTYLAFS